MTPVPELPRIVRYALSSSEAAIQAKELLSGLQDATTKALARYRTWRISKSKEMEEKDPEYRMLAEMAKGVKTRRAISQVFRTPNTTSFTAIYDTPGGVVEVEVNCSSVEREHPDPDDISITMVRGDYSYSYEAAQETDPKIVIDYTELMQDIATNPAITFRFS